MKKYYIFRDNIYRTLGEIKSEVRLSVMIHGNADRYDGQEISQYDDERNLLSVHYISVGRRGGVRFN